MIRILWLALIVLGAASRPAASQDVDTAVEYAIGPEDVLDIAVWNNTEISRTVPVRPDGRISLPLLNDIQAAGLTPLQLKDVLVTALGTYIPQPNVSVIVREIHSFKVTVIGEVKTPGRYELRSRTTVLDVLAMAGGLGQYASRNRITVLRREGGKPLELAYDYDKVASRTGGKPAAQDNFCVQAGDIILVP
jgi:polysaccharide biosynthesis/export protein